MENDIPPRALDIYVASVCFGCGVARQLADQVRTWDLPGVHVRLLDLDDPETARPDSVFAVPTYLLNGQVLSLGNPEVDWLCRQLKARAPGIADHMCDWMLHMKKESTLPERVVAWARRSPQGRNAAAPSRTDLQYKPDYLQEMDIFAPLSPAERTWLLENTAMVTCEQGRVFYSPDDAGEVIFILKRGKVNLYRLTGDGRKLVTATLSAHTIFGEMGLIGQRMYGCFAEAAEECLLCVLSRSDMQALVRRNPEVGLLLLGEVERRFQEREAELMATAFRALPARLAALLLREANASGVVAGLSHQDLAERLGTYRETVSQLLGRLRDEGLVSMERKRIHILDAEGLRIYAEAD